MIFLLVAVPSAIRAQASICSVDGTHSSFTIFGDSRAGLLFMGTPGTTPDNSMRPAARWGGVADKPANYPTGTINGAEAYPGGPLIIQEGQIKNHPQDQFWFGSGVTYSFPMDQNTVAFLKAAAIWAVVSAFGPFGFFALAAVGNELMSLIDTIGRAVPPTTSSAWNDRLLRCAADGVPYRPSPRTVISLGGNDMKDFFQDMERSEALYLLTMAVMNPLQFMKDTLLHGGSKRLHLEAFWLWSFEAKEDQIVEGIKSIVHYHLDNATVQPPEPNQVMLA